MAGLIVLYQGSRGSGKTLSMTLDALELLLSGWKLFSNYETPFSEYMSDIEILSLDRNSELRDCVIMIDELQIFFDSREWKNSSSIGFSHFIQQIRKRNIIILGTTQYVDTIEKRIRQHIDILVCPDFDSDSLVCHNVVADLTSVESFNKKPLIFEYFFYAEPIFKLYDTNKIL